MHMHLSVTDQYFDVSDFRWIDLDGCFIQRCLNGLMREGGGRGGSSGPLFLYQSVVSASEITLNKKKVISTVSKLVKELTPQHHVAHTVLLVISP